MIDSGPEPLPGHPPDRIRLDLTGVPETLVIPLFSKAQDYRSRRSILHDAKADEIVRSLDYDFSRLRAAGSARTRLLAARARQLDEWVRDYLARQPTATVLNLGCGLDTRIARLAPRAPASWFDIDFSEVVQIRRRFFAERDGYRMLAASLTDGGWLAEVPCDRPAIAVADGVLGYLAPEQVTSLLQRIVARFPTGEIVFDVMSRSALRRGSNRGQDAATALLRWFVDDLAQVDAIDPRLRRVEVHSALASRYLPPGVRAAYGLVWLVPSMRRLIRFVRCEF